MYRAQACDTNMHACTHTHIHVNLLCFIVDLVPRYFISALIINLGNRTMPTYRHCNKHIWAAYKVSQTNRSASTNYTRVLLVDSLKFRNISNFSGRSKMARFLSSAPQIINHVTVIGGGLMGSGIAQVSSTCSTIMIFDGKCQVVNAPWLSITGIPKSTQLIPKLIWIAKVAHIWNKFNISGIIYSLGGSRDCGQSHQLPFGDRTAA